MQDWLTRDEQLGYLYIKLWGSSHSLSGNGNPESISAYISLHEESWIGTFKLRLARMAMSRGCVSDVLTHTKYNKVNEPKLVHNGRLMRIDDERHKQTKARDITDDGEGHSRRR
ncbi:hypothetical protein Syun_006730 [Stephania yunnanensis]|uniref:Uncharacterized protein n=1 Tax=Stephania yunnanensis TaxID=152371 RepID=A0AAP0PZK8_9MAGN